MGNEIRLAGGQPRAGGGLRRSGVLAAAVFGLTLAAPGASAQERACGAGAQGHSRGEWPTYGHDLTNSRSQPAEQSIGADNVTSLEAAWVHKAGGAVNSTPIVAGGCLFIGSSDGTVHALDADSGEAVWSAKLPITKPAYGGGIVGAPAVTGGSVLVAINQEGSPYLASLDRAT